MLTHRKSAISQKLLKFASGEREVIEDGKNSLEC